MPSGTSIPSVLKTDAGSAISFALNFATVDVSYQPQKADGGKDGGPVKFGWNIRQNVKA